MDHWQVFEREKEGLQDERDQQQVFDSRSYSEAQPDDTVQAVNPTISQDHTGGKEELERGLLMAYGYSHDRNTSTRLSRRRSRDYTGPIPVSEPGPAKTAAKTTGRRLIQPDEDGRPPVSLIRSRKKRRLQRNNPIYRMPSSRTDEGPPRTIVEDPREVREAESRALDPSGESEPGQAISRAFNPAMPHGSKSSRIRAEHHGEVDVGYLPPDGSSGVYSDSECDIMVAQPPNPVPLVADKDTYRWNPDYSTELERLRFENANLRLENSKLQQLWAENSLRALPSRWIVLHSVESRLYKDMPMWTRDTENDWYLEGKRPISDREIFLERQKNTDVAFIIFFKYYSKRQGQKNEDSEERHAFLPTGNSASVEREQTSIQFLCPVLKNTWNSLLDQDKTLKEYCQIKCKDGPGCDDSCDKNHIFTDFDTFFYYFRPCIQDKIPYMDNEERQQLELLMSYVDEDFRDEYDKANTLFDDGLVTSDYIKYLSPPGTVLVSNKEHHLGFLQKSFIRRDFRHTWELNVVSWAFDGKFRKKATTLRISSDEIGKIPKKIASLSFCPLKYVANEIKMSLRKRGHTFWGCRKSAYITYEGLDAKGQISYFSARFLVDVRTYWTMHGSEKNKDELYVLHRDEPDELDELDGRTMSCDDPPEGNFVYLLPANIYGFDMQEKNWVDLQVDNIHPLQWNKGAFHSLAIDNESKELIDALVNNKIAAEKATDMVAGKGNGLIILLHGGPGTGKTLTAESVAEIAEKPLYRVTCGDIGTEPRQVEKYLQQVFHLGKLWSCVVLLDEADVFLEQRSLADLSRNALVSVFLRTLEYYDGILILTSNRVGTFDEAFKSRIQLALHYKPLDGPQRQQIWKNFTERLETLQKEGENGGEGGERIDTKAIMKSIDNLAKYEMNGRQIRNAITTARQLALFKKEMLSIKHLEHSIKVSGKFDKYLEEVHDNIKDDEMARQDSIR